MSLNCKESTYSVTLCKLAVESYQNKDDSVITFNYLGKRWRFLDFLRSSLSMEQIVAAINVKLTKANVYKIDIIEDRGQNWIALFFINNSSHDHWMGKLNLPSTIFSTFFHEVESDFVLAKNHQESSKVIKKYVTTTLFEALYQKHLALSETDTNNRENIIPQLPRCFRPKLCRYQQKAVAWLCKREREPTKIPELYVKLRAKDNETIVYAHKVYMHVLDSEPETVVLPPGGILADEMGLGKTVEILALILLHPRPPFRDIPEAFSSHDFSLREPKRQCLPTVFCLCGSNALKKIKNANIQCTRCELWQHKKCVCHFNGEHDETTINDPYICPHCWSDLVHKEQKLVPSRATIIVSPNTIKLQWLAEIRKHVYPSLRVFLYDGISKNIWISPRQLADYDVVLTDYNVLRKEFYHTADNESDRVTRKKPRHMRCNTPLLMVEWWRVCLDEAQMVESNISITAKLAFQLPAVNRWAVTGTPIQSSIDDLHSLLAFIGFDEICYPRIIWDTLVSSFLTTTTTTSDELKQEPVSEANKLLIDLLQLCMWRTCKSNIANQLKIPPQNEKVHYITLSDLEKLFYSEQHAACEEDFNEKFTNYIQRAKTTAEISPQIMKIFLEPLLKIRQCCTIPVVVKNSSNKANHFIGQKKFLQPKQLHAHLKSTNEMECKTELRSMASSYNGMAGIYFIRKQYADAIRHYELVLQLARDYTGLNINVDSLLQIHALHNILQAFYTAPNNEQLHPSNVIADYEDQCNKLEWKYLETYASQMKCVQQAFEAEKEAYYTTETNVEMDLTAFVAALAEIISTDYLHIPLMEKIYDECVQVFSNCEIMKMVTSIHSALYVVTTWHDKVLNVIRDLNSRLEQLKFFTNNVRSRSQVAASVWRDMMQFVIKVRDCHMSEIRFKRKQNDGKDQSKSILKQALCDLCDIRDILNSYECLLFNKVIDKETNLTEGLENPSPQIALIKAIFNFTKSKPKFHRFSSEFDKHWERIKCMQRMCKKMWKYWIEIEYTVKAYDELDMCKMRISLTQNKEERSNFRLLECELETMMNEQHLNLQTTQTAFALKLARLKYILHLEKNFDPGSCPICHSEDESRYAVLECGHHICLACLDAMQFKFYKNKKLTCSICRNQQNSKKLYYVTRTNERDATEFDIKGNYSSKISFIVHQLLQLQKEGGSEENGPKVIIFSQWEPILDAIAAALGENEIRYRLKWSPKSIEDFKNPHMNITCMLMVLSKGSKGLNLIEATHVFLVEPILNPAEELQAIGRVHRFGQTKPTTVHRFIVLNTIEENIFYTVTKGKETSLKWEFENMNLESLRNLFHFKNNVIHCY